MNFSIILKPGIDSWRWNNFDVRVRVINDFQNFGWHGGQYMVISWHVLTAYTELWQNTIYTINLSWPQTKLRTYKSEMVEMEILNVRWKCAVCVITDDWLFEKLYNQMPLSVMKVEYVGELILDVRVISVRLIVWSKLLWTEYELFFIISFIFNNDLKFSVVLHIIIFSKIC